MYARLRNPIRLLALSVFLFSCASQPTKTKGTEVGQTQQQQPQNPTNQQGQQTTVPAQQLHVALVLGGAGVASFATVGILKRFHQEGVKIDFIFATGWPALFAAGEGFLKSVHDLEWFAMRLKPNEFFGTGLLDFSKDFSAHDKLQAALREQFKQSDLNQSTVPLYLSSSPVGRNGVNIQASGSWEAPLLRAMSVPGIYRPYEGAISSLNGVDVAEALKRRSAGLIAVDMYEDYLNFLVKGQMDGSLPLFRALYAHELRENLNAQMAQAPIRGKIVLNAGPNELDRRREAILAGFREGTRLIAELRKHVGE